MIEDLLTGHHRICGNHAVQNKFIHLAQYCQPKAIAFQDEAALQRLLTQLSTLTNRTNYSASFAYILVRVVTSRGKVAYFLGTALVHPLQARVKPHHALDMLKKESTSVYSGDGETHSCCFILLAKMLSTIHHFNRGMLQHS